MGPEAWDSSGAWRSPRVALIFSRPSLRMGSHLGVGWTPWGGRFWMASLPSPRWDNGWQRVAWGRCGRRGARGPPCLLTDEGPSALRCVPPTSRRGLGPSLTVARYMILRLFISMCYRWYPMYLGCLFCLFVYVEFFRICLQGNGLYLFPCTSNFQLL